ncbi:RsmB/NOP family class I SAM-dependent RNA methyltransferase [Rhodobacterales bacterium HKCCE3408]|nr:RsmB/NOP family class I SAM-dependent RNA methyltransferase [Rhodobacterales bacterium HKCCE3408]
MTPAARLQAAIEVLSDWQNGQAAEQALTRWARGARYAGSKDRRAVRDHVYEVLRRRGNCEAAGGGDDPRSLVLGLVRLQGGDAAALFSGEGHGPVALNVAEQARLAEPVEADPGRDVPGWLRARLSEHHGADWPGILAAQAERAPVYLRVNTAKTDRELAAGALAAEGIETVSEPACATALRVTSGGGAVARSAAYASGLVELQDLSPQIACASIDWGPGRVLDYCAGGGGKALAIAAATGRPVHVHDAEPRRMADLPARAARAGAELPVLDDPEAAAPFDIVLTDVPCSGSGTWRRDPEAKWRLTEARLAALLTVQDAILTRAAGLVAPGGRLVYMTCSLLPEENEARIAAFLADRPDWRCTLQRALLPPAASDGFFVAELTHGARGA